MCFSRRTYSPDSRHSRVHLIANRRHDSCISQTLDLRMNARLSHKLRTQLSRRSLRVSASPPGSHDQHYQLLTSGRTLHKLGVEVGTIPGVASKFRASSEAWIVN